jgi:hypothetical protein
MQCLMGVFSPGTAQGSIEFTGNFFNGAGTKAATPAIFESARKS